MKNKNKYKTIYSMLYSITQIINIRYKTIFAIHTKKFHYHFMKLSFTIHDEKFKTKFKIMRIKK